jgi:hypothetical protein
MKIAHFLIDDVVWVLRDVARNRPRSLFDNPFLAMLKNAYKRYGVKTQLNLFYRLGDFDLSQMPDCYRREWEAQAHWLKLSFHSKLENELPYISSGYDEVFRDCHDVHCEILRFASEINLAATTTVHYCRATNDGIRALYDNGVRGLLGLYGTPKKPRCSYQTTPEQDFMIRNGEISVNNGIAYAGIDVVINDCTVDEIHNTLRGLMDRSFIKLMIHEQYFYPDYVKYQKDFENKLRETFVFLTSHGYRSVFFESLI